MDDFIVSQFPLVAAGRAGVPKAEKHGIRYVAARDGLWREVSVPWMRCLLPHVVHEGANTPYAPLQPKVEINVAPPAPALWAELFAYAKSAMPNECAAVMVLNTCSGAWRFAPRKSMSASGDHVDYEEPALGEDELVVVDLHSHASHGAWFSDQDDKDDRGGIKLAAVVGDLDGVPTLAARLVVLDRFIPVDIGSDGQWEVKLC